LRYGRFVAYKERRSRSKREIENVDTIGLEVAAKYVTLEGPNVNTNDHELRTRLEDVLRDDEKQSGLDSVFNSDFHSVL
jgi:DNA-directed RNA polymerase I subunit RPA1